MAIKKLFLKDSKLPKSYYVKAEFKKDEVIEVMDYNPFKRRRIQTVFGSKLHLKPADGSMRSIFVHIPSTMTEHLPTIIDRKTVSFKGDVIVYAQHYKSESGNNSVRTLLFADKIVSDDNKLEVNIKDDVTNANDLLNETVSITDISVLKGTTIPLTTDIVDVKKSLGEVIEFLGFNREDYVRNSRTGELDMSQIESRSYDILLKDLNVMMSVKILASDVESEYDFKMFDRLELIEPEFTAYAVNDSNYGFAVRAKGIKQVLNVSKEEKSEIKKP